MGAPYHQFCPVAKAMELLDERWTLLLVRELVTGTERFNDLRRGLPRMSPTLLSRRLQQLVRAGVAERVEDDGEVRYRLTLAGRELRPVVEALGAWGVRWIGEIGDADLDPKLLLWDMHRNVDLDAVPAQRTVVRFRFTDPQVTDRDWWIVISDGDVDVCDEDPGHPVAASLTGSLRGVVRWWLGDVSWPSLVRSGEVDVDAPSGVRRALPDWFVRSPFAAVPRPPVSAGRVELPATR